MLRPIPASLVRKARQAWRSHFGSRNARGGWVDTVTPDWVMAGLLDCRQAMVPVTTKAVAQDERHVDRLALQFQKSVVVIR